MRWATILVGAVLTFSQRLTTPNVVACIALVAFAVVRSLAPATSTRLTAKVTGITVEAATAMVAVAFTGWWTSPFVFTFLSGIVVAGVAEGFAGAVPLAVAMALVTTLGHWPANAAEARFSTTGATELFLVALVVGYGRRLFGQAELRTLGALSRLRQLTEANDLLKQLNQLAQTLPASLDLDQTVGSTIEQLRSALHADVVAVFLWEAALRMWSVAGAEGARVEGLVDEGILPAPVRLAAQMWSQDGGAFLVDLSADGPGLGPATRVGIYAPLVARQTLVGVLLVESQSPSALTPDDLQYVSGLAEQAALAIDNAIWFGRLRTVGAEEERSRIARDLHDRVAQSLAYLAFELERLVGLSAKQPVTADLAILRDDVRRVVIEVRDTLYDLRTDVSDSQDLTATLATFLDRVQHRSGLVVEFEPHVSHSLAVPVERELWRIVQEAITNVERHAHASVVKVEWTVGDDVAEIVVSDDGRGFPWGAAGRLDSYGLVGMRERADAIGGQLGIETAPGEGTTIRCKVEVA